MAPANPEEERNLINVGLAERALAALDPYNGWMCNTKEIGDFLLRFAEVFTPLPQKMGRMSATAAQRSAVFPHCHVHIMHDAALLVYINV